MAVIYGIMKTRKERPMMRASLPRGLKVIVSDEIAPFGVVPVSDALTGPHCGKKAITTGRTGLFMLPNKRFVPAVGVIFHQTVEEEMVPLGAVHVVN
jgi:hypothetical protein